MLLYEPRKSKIHGHVSGIYVIRTDGYQAPNVQMVDWTAKVITVQSGSGLTMKTWRSAIYAEIMKAGFRGEIERKIVGATHPAASTAMTIIVARITRRNDTASAGIGIGIAPTIDAMKMSFMSMTDAARMIGSEVDHDIDIDPARSDQTENIISLAIGHIDQPDPPHPPPQIVIGTMALRRE